MACHAKSLLIYCQDDHRQHISKWSLFELQTFYFLEIHLKMSSANILQFLLQWRHNEHHGASNHRHLNSLFKRLRINENMKAPRHWSLWGNPPVDSPHKGPVTQKRLPFHDVTMCPGLNVLTIMEWGGIKGSLWDAIRQVAFNSSTPVRSSQKARDIDDLFPFNKLWSGQNGLPFEDAIFRFILLNKKKCLTAIYLLQLHYKASVEWTLLSTYLNILSTLRAFIMRNVWRNVFINASCVNGYV